MKLSEYTSYDATGLGELVSKGEVHPREVAHAGLQAIELMNPHVNAVIETFYDAVQSLPDKAPDGLFPGVPFLIKDIGANDSGVKMELGSRLARGLPAPPYQSEQIRRIRSTGVTVLGRTNVPELGSSCTTEPLLYGPTRNPWDLSRTAGGSSGGAAAAVAAGMVPIAQANDAGGSIRVPAACCGLVGLKPSRNLAPVGPGVGLALDGLACEHIVSHSVRDTAAMLDVTAGPDAGAWCYTPRYPGSYLGAAEQAPRQLRIALVSEAIFPPARLSDEASVALASAAKLCEQLGHIVQPLKFEFDTEPVLKGFSMIWSAHLRVAIERLSGATGRPIDATMLEPHLLAAWRDTAAYTSSDLLWAQEQMNIACRAYGGVFEAYDVMLTPVLAMEPFEIGRIGSIPAPTFFEWFMGMCAHSPFTSTANIAGIPAMSLPLFESANGLPMGSHFLARMGDEFTLLQLAFQLEQATPWSHRKPRLFAS